MRKLLFLLGVKLKGEELVADMQFYCFFSV